MSVSCVQRSTDRLFRPSEHRHTLALVSPQFWEQDYFSLTLVCRIPVNQIVQLSALLPWDHNCCGGALHVAWPCWCEVKTVVLDCIRIDKHVCLYWCTWNLLHFSLLTTNDSTFDRLLSVGAIHWLCASKKGMIEGSGWVSPSEWQYMAAVASGCRKAKGAWYLLT